MTPSDLRVIVGEVAARWRDPDYDRRSLATEATLEEDNRYTFEAVVFAVNQQMSLLEPAALREWTGDEFVSNARRIVVVNPGNVPLAGLQDFLAVVLLGHRYLGKLSSRSPHLLAAFVDDLLAHGAEFEAGLSTKIPDLSRHDAVIASGFDETVSLIGRAARHAGIPDSRILMRGSRFSIALIGQREPDELAERLAEDILLHEGLGCRNVAVVWAPERSTPDRLLAAMAKFRALFPAHPATIGSLKMQIAYYQAASHPHAYAEDGSFLVSKGDPEVQRPAHIRWSEYEGLEQVRAWILEHWPEIQLVVAQADLARALDLEGVSVVEPGEAQRPPLGWEQDRQDVVRFLRRL